jgi:hypothetical protein
VAGWGLLALTDDLDHLLPDGVEADAEALESLGGDSFALIEQTEEDVLGADVVVVEESSLLLRQYDDSAGPISETFEQGILLAGSSAAVRKYTRVAISPFVTHQVRIKGKGDRSTTTLVLGNDVDGVPSSACRI